MTEHERQYIYTENDIISIRDDAKECVGKKVYYGFRAEEVLTFAKIDKYEGVLTSINPNGTFRVLESNGSYGDYTAIIRKAEDVTYSPYIFDNIEDREYVKGKWVLDCSCDWYDEAMIVGLHRNALGVWYVCIFRHGCESWITAEQLRRFHFSNGEKCARAIKIYE